MEDMEDTQLRKGKTRLNTLSRKPGKPEAKLEMIWMFGFVRENTNIILKKEGKVFPLKIVLLKHFSVNSSYLWDLNLLLCSFFIENGGKQASLLLQYSRTWDTESLETRVMEVFKKRE